ncbi:MAG: spore germination protein [Desulfitobacteriaceae bacterium]|nr:spore germination protein [Desulfitobacteriaceae bacterium]MDD4345373.1 spore germination protein [Desulfitobacteriaceae bacterium]MDD4400304.1 spore germination protein [Desulfitobacteriaceae bacterium]
MLKEITIRPKDKKRIRKHDPLPVEQGWSQTLSLDRVREVLSKSSDIIFRDFILQGKEAVACSLVVVDGLVDKHLLDQFILKALMVDSAGHPELVRMTVKTALATIEENLAPANEIKKISEIGEAIDAILSGDAVLFIGQTEEALVIGARGWVNRGVKEPETASVVRGPREGFSETLRINTSLIRRKIKHPSLRLVSLKIGDLTRTDVVVAYVENVASPDIVSEVLRRLGKIKVDGVLETGSLEMMIEDNPYSPFPQIGYTERPDDLAAELLEGKVGIIADGTPIVLTVPAVFAQFLQVSEDYYERALIMVLVRFIRYVGLALALLAPSVYIAATTFHHEILPTSLALSIASGREGVPFSAAMEALIMIIILEILQEAGLRLPKPIGQTVGIVGALVIGDAAVKASLVSPIMVIIVGITAISSYAIPAYDLAITVRLLRLPLIIIAGTMGFFGVAVALYGLLIHVLSLRSFGVPYFSPIVPLRIREFLQDVVVVVPIWGQKHRPNLIDTAEPEAGRKK